MAASAGPASAETLSTTCWPPGRDASQARNEDDLLSLQPPPPSGTPRPRGTRCSAEGAAKLLFPPPSSHGHDFYSPRKHSCRVLGAHACMQGVMNTPMCLCVFVCACYGSICSVGACRAHVHQRPGCSADAGRGPTGAASPRAASEDFLLSASERNMDGLESAGLISHLHKQQKVLEKPTFWLC